jgi:subtilisin family serine protease
VEATAALGLTLEPGGTVRVIVEAEPGQGQAVEEGLRTGGYRVELRFEDLIQLRAEPARLAELSGLPGVRFVRRPFEPLPAVTSEGVSVIRADGWQAAGIRGQGVRVGVLDRGFYGYQALLGSELPPASRVIVRSFRADGDITGGGVQHGTGAAEVIYDIAPDATFYLANYSTSVEWANAIGWLVSEGVHVVNYSGGFLWCPANGNNFYTAQVDRARQNGVLWVNSAGNQARSHWWGYYNDPDTDRWLNFSFADEANDLTTFSSAFLSAGTPVWAWLCWEDLSYPLAPLYDYDLYLVDASSGLVIGPPCASENNQQTYRYPFEWFTCLLPYSGYYGLAVWCRSANCSPLTRLHLFVWRSREHPFELEYSTAVRSLITPADAAGSFTVGAVRWNDLGLEPYSSQGPTEDGRTKPDIVAPTRVSTWSYGYQGFGGTSASAPHVAGAAALVKAAFPQWGPAEIQAFLEGRARDLGPAGKDNAYGSGALDLGSAPTPPSAHRLWLPFIIRW